MKEKDKDGNRRNPLASIFNGPIPDVKRIRRDLFKYKDHFIQLIFKELHSIMVMLDDFRAGPIPLRDLINGTRPSKFHEF